MAWAPDYCTAAELKTHLRITDTDDDTPLGISITAASRAVDHACNRQFGQTSPAAARYYTWEGGEMPVQHSRYGYREMLEIDDLMSTTNLVVKGDYDDDGVYETTLTAAAANLYPWNAAANGRPWTHLVLSANEAFPTLPRAVEITALWGWSAVPTLVKQATLVQAARFFSRRNSPFGIAGSPELGSELRLLARLDPDVAQMLGTVARPWVVR